MKYKRKIGFVIVILLIINYASTRANRNDQKISDSHSSFLFIEHLPILIQNDTAFSYYDFPGNGTKTNPYLIQNLNITTNASIGIEIKNTSKFFSIRECYIDAQNYGISISNVSAQTATIVNNTCSNNIRNGVTVSTSDEPTVVGNRCELNIWHGISVGSSYHPIVTNNFCSNNGRVGIFLSHCNGSKAFNNTCEENSYGGLLLDYCQQSVVETNFCYNNTFLGGIRLYGSNSSRVHNNSCGDNIGTNILIFSAGNVNLTENYCFAAGMGILVSFSENCTLESNFCSTFYMGIRIDESLGTKAYHNQLEKCGFSFAAETMDVLLTYNLQANSVNGQPLGYLCNLQNFKIKKPSYGQLVLINCSEGVIANQQLAETQIAVDILYSNNLVLKKSQLNSNIEGGIHLKNSYNIEILNCTSSYNKQYGLLAEHSSYCTIVYNVFKLNTLWGVVLDLYSRNNSVHHNSFIDNNYYYGTAQAEDDGKNNTWYDEETLEGNYWSDYFPVVGSYYLDGLAHSQDLYPLTEPPVYKNQLVNYAYFAFILVIPVAIYSSVKFVSRQKRK